MANTSSTSATSKFETPQRTILPSRRKRSNALTVSASGIRPRQCSRYKSSRSVPRRFKLRSQAAIALLAPALCGYTLLTTTTRSRWPAIADPTTSSAPPSPYISAVSMSVIPRSMPRRSAAISPARSRLRSPIPHVPSPSAGTRAPSASVTFGIEEADFIAFTPDRVLHPMRRVGRKGQGRFARIGWDEALDEIAAHFKAITASSDGPEAIVPYSYCGTMGLVQSASMDRRFFHRLGASLLDRTICATAGKVGWNSVIGASIGMDGEQFENSRLIIIWGGNPI